MSSSDQPEHRKQEAEEETAGAAAAEDEDTGAEVAPIVKLQEVAVTTGEEDEIVLLDLYVLFPTPTPLFPIFCLDPVKLDIEIRILNFIFFILVFGSRESDCMVGQKWCKFSSLIVF